MTKIERILCHAIEESIFRGITVDIHSDSIEEYEALSDEALYVSDDSSDVIGEPASRAQMYWGEDDDGHEWQLRIFLEE